MTKAGLAVAASVLLLTACAPAGSGIGGAAFLDAGLRAQQEQACAQAVSATRGVPIGTIVVRRASSDPVNQSIVNAFAGGASGYCRVDINANVLQVVF